MDAATFDHLTRTLFHTTSRRAALGALVAAAGLGRAVSPAAAQGCLANGKRCHDGTECCSGKCKRRNKGGRKRCRQADNQGICTVEGNVCGTGTASCGTRSGAGNCFCFVTTQGQSFCADGRKFQDEPCGECASNQDCEEHYGKGTKCLRSGPNCICPQSTWCTASCPNLDPVP